MARPLASSPRAAHDRPMDPLEPSTFEGDVEVSIRYREDEALLSERLMRRLVLMGAAYGLHRLPLLDRDSELNALQASSLASELEFIRSLVPTDRALGRAISELAHFAQRTARDSMGRLAVEWP